MAETSTRKTITATTLPISKIIRDGRYQIRRKMYRAKIKEYTSAYQIGVELPPIQVALVSGESYILVDGWHRLAALERLDRHEVETEVVEAKDGNEVAWLAAKANTTHGIPLTTPEIRKMFRAYVKAGKHRRGRGGFKSYRDIALDLNGIRTHVTIYRWMQRDFPRTAQRMSDEEMPKGQIGEQEPPDPSRELAELAGDGVRKAFNSFAGITDPLDRGQVIYEMEIALAEMKKSTYQAYTEDF